MARLSNYVIDTEITDENQNMLPSRTWLDERIYKIIFIIYYNIL